MTGDGGTILVVTEIEGLARLYQVWLQEAQYTVEVVTDAESPTAERSVFDVVILDRSGSTSATEQDPDDAGTLVLSTTLDRVFEVIELRFDEYVLEPASKADLVGALARVRNREAYDQRLQEFARSMVTIALVRQGSTAEQREANAAYRDLVDRFLRLHDETEATIRELDDEEVVAVFGDDRATLVRNPTNCLNVRPNASD